MKESQIMKANRVVISGVVVTLVCAASVRDIAVQSAEDSIGSGRVIPSAISQSASYGLYNSSILGSGTSSLGLTRHYRLGANSGLGASSAQTDATTSESFALQSSLSRSSPIAGTESKSLNNMSVAPTNSAYSGQIASPAMLDPWSLLLPVQTPASVIGVPSSIREQRVIPAQFPIDDFWGDQKHYGSVSSEPSLFPSEDNSLIGVPW